MALESLLCPENIAVIGASRHCGKVGHEIIVNLKEGGFAGTIVPVNPHADEILGLKCYQSLQGYTGQVDLSLVAVPYSQVCDAVESSIKAGAGVVIVITSGFRESGSDGGEMEMKVLKLCRAAGVRLLGPNCLGVINTNHRMNASFSQRMPSMGSVSVFSQSGAICTTMLDWANARQLGLSKVVSIGNKADINEIDLLEEFANDDDTRVIVGYLESITTGEKFIKVAESVSSVKPVIIFRAGVTPSGIKAASAHTGNLAGDDIAYAAAFKRSGIIRAESIDRLVDCAAAFWLQELPSGDRVAIVTNAGGPGVMAVDVVDQLDLKMAELSGDTLDALKKELPVAVGCSNPVDLLGDAGPKRFGHAINLLRTDDGVDAVLVIITPHAMTDPVEIARNMIDGKSGGKPVLVVYMGSTDMMFIGQQFAAMGLPAYSSPERALAALRAMVDYAAWRNRTPRIVTRFPVNRRRIERIISRHAKTKRTLIGEVGAKEILRAYDFSVPEGQVANSPEEAVVAAEKIGFPVAMKIVSPDILHKSDVGGIKLQISSSEEVRDTYDLLSLRLNRHAPEARLFGIYVEKMCARGLEVILGMKYDPQFGPLLMFGLGGIFVDILKDVSCYPAPISAKEALQMLMGTRSYAMLQNARGQADIDLNMIASGLQRISQMAVDFPQIKELNINPYIVGSTGADPVAVDARIILSEASVE